jgi:hypothetical protein
VHHERQVEDGIAHDSNTESVGILPDKVACEEPSVTAPRDRHTVPRHQPCVNALLQRRKAVLNVHLHSAASVWRAQFPEKRTLCSVALWSLARACSQCGACAVQRCTTVSSSALEWRVASGHSADVWLSLRCTLYRSCSGLALCKWTCRTALRRCPGADACNAALGSADDAYSAALGSAAAGRLCWRARQHSSMQHRAPQSRCNHISRQQNVWTTPNACNLL